jgi:hypothetical protein
MVDRLSTRKHYLLSRFNHAFPRMSPCPPQGRVRTEKRLLALSGSLNPEALDGSRYRLVFADFSSKKGRAGTPSWPRRAPSLGGVEGWRRASLLNSASGDRRAFLD